MLGLGIASRQHRDATEELAGEIPLRAYDPAEPVEPPLHPDELLQLLLSGLAEDRLLDPVDALVVVLERGEEEDEVAVLLHLGALTELLRILERQRMEAKDLPQERHLTLVGLQEVEPEVLAGG